MILSDLAKYSVARRSIARSLCDNNSTELLIALALSGAIMTDAVDSTTKVTVVLFVSLARW